METLAYLAIGSLVKYTFWRHLGPSSRGPERSERLLLAVVHRGQAWSVLYVLQSRPESSLSENLTLARDQKSPQRAIFQGGRTLQQVRGVDNFTVMSSKYGLSWL